MADGFSVEALRYAEAVAGPARSVPPLLGSAVAALDDLSAEALRATSPDVAIVRVGVSPDTCGLTRFTTQLFGADLDAQLVTVRAQVTDAGSGPRLGAPKTDSGTRVVPVDRLTVEVLKCHRPRQHHERAACGAAWPDLEPGDTGT